MNDLKFEPIVIGPEEKVVIILNAGTSREALERLNLMAQFFFGLKKVLVIAGDLKIKVIKDENNG